MPPGFLNALQDTKLAWQQAGYDFTAFIDRKALKKLSFQITTEHNFEDLSGIVETESWAKETFESIRSVSSHVDIEVLEQIV